MENNSLYLEDKLDFTYKANRQKGGIAACVLVVVATFLLYLFAVLWWGHPLLYKGLPALFLLSGCAHLFLLQKNLTAFSLAEQWLFTVAMTAMLAGLLGFSSIWDDKLSWQVILAGACAFLLPFTIAELWRVYSDISFSGFRYWQLSDEKADDLPAIYLKSIKVRFKVIQEPAVGRGGIIPVSASARMTLSEVFFAMVQQQNKAGSYAIALRSRELEPYAWVFYKMDMQLWYRSLDPDKSLQENGIGKNSMIYVQRVSKDAFSSPGTKEKKFGQP
jgi:hypothetical protein